MAFDTLFSLKQLAPLLEEFKILKVFHSKNSVYQSIFQSD